MEAFNRLPPSIAADSRLIIAGEDWGDEKGLPALIRSSPYADQITFIPEFVPESAVSRYFSAADVVALPYTRTSGSGVASLAMAYGKPIIISDLEGTRFALQGYKGALFTPPGDASELATRIAEVYAQHKAGRVLYYEVPSHLTWPNIISQYQEIIRKSLEGLAEAKTLYLDQYRYDNRSAAGILIEEVAQRVSNRGCHRSVVIELRLVI